MIEEDHCVYVKRSKESFIILSLYVDDILLVGNNKEFIKTIKEWLFSTFEMKDMGEASFVLGVKILRDLDKHKSTSGYTFLLGGEAITWFSKN